MILKKGRDRVQSPPEVQAIEINTGGYKKARFSKLYLSEFKRNNHVFQYLVKTLEG